MPKQTRSLAHAAALAAMYLVLTHLQNFLLPGSTTMATQFRISEALCIFALFTPAAIPGLTAGCLLFSLTSGAVLPLDFLLGSLATLAMWKTRGIQAKGLPVLGLTMPALFNALLVGWELTHYIGGGFFLNALGVAIGEAAVLFTLGTLLYCTIKMRRLDERLFG